MALTPQQFEALKQRLAQNKQVSSPSSGTMSNAFQSGVSQMKQSFQQSREASNPLEAIESGITFGAGAINTAFSPLAPIVEPIAKPIRKGVEFVADKISDIPEVQKFAQTKAGETTERIAEDVGNLSTIAATATIGPRVPQVAGTVAKTAVKPVAPIARGTGRTLKNLGEKSYSLTVTPEEGALLAKQSYEATRGSVFNKVKNVMTGDDIDKPTMPANTAARKGLVGTEWQLGVQAKRVADDLWTKTIAPRLDEVKGQVGMKSFFGTVEKQIKRGTKELSRKNAKLEALQALREEFKNVNNVSLKKLQAYKEGWAEFIPEATYKGKPIASALKDVKNVAAEQARKVIYKFAGDDIKQAYIDYGNLKSIAKAGIKSVGDPAKKGISRNVWEFVMDKLVTPVATISGKVLYRTGEGFEFIGKKGARKVGDVIK